MNYFVWASGLAKTSPLGYALVNILTMAVIGMALAVAAELIFKALRIDLGRYKKEYEEPGTEAGK
jgi:hypothetical protein